MIYSFYKTGQFLPGIDDKDHPDFLFSQDINIDERIEKIEFDLEAQKVSIVEIPGAKKNLVFNQLINGETEDLQGFTFSNTEIGDVIMSRNFGGNINAQLAALSKSNIKVLAILANVVGKQTIQAVFADEIALAKSISKTRVLFGLPPFDLSFLD